MGGIADTVTVVGRSEELDRLKDAICAGDAALRFVTGGATRQESVRIGLESMDASDGDIVLVHDGARPLTSYAVIERCIRSATEHGGAIAAYPMSDTMWRAQFDGLITDPVDRSSLWAAQTPQASTYGRLLRAHRCARDDGFEGTDDASLLERSQSQPVVVMGARENIKITTPDDLAFAERWLRAERQAGAIRIGMGYDIHRLVPGRKLILGGVEIPSDVGLLGHSDADVVLHAICDALLGAAGLPDIGQQFPNTDATFAGASSLSLLSAVYTLLSDAGYRVGNVDCCVIAERPKIAAYADRMRAHIADAVEVAADRVSVKATTNEGLGSLGAGEGIACHATAVLFA